MDIINHDNILSFYWRIMSWSNLSNNPESKPDILSAELQEIAQDSKELRDEIQNFEYKNRSKDWKYYVFSYNTISSDWIDNIKRKYVNQYWWNMEELLVTDVNWKVINDSEFVWWGKVYLKVKISSFPKPIEFVDISKSWQTRKSCTIKFPWWDVASLKQFYKDEFNKTIENDWIIISDGEWNTYDNNHKFKAWEAVFIAIKEKVGTTQTNTNWENKEKKNRENPFKEMIENQKGPVMHWNREKPEISITIDDWNWAPNIKHILNTLRWSWIRATFFILWTSIKENSSLRKQAIEEWHQVCCHTYSHIYLSDKTDITDIRNTLSGKEITNWMSNVKFLLWIEYFNKLKLQVWNDFPFKISSDLLLRTEILMWEAQIKNSLWKPYLNKLKSNFPFFRFPGWCWWFREKNIKVLKDLWYLSIWWSDDFYRWTGKNRKHIAAANVWSLDISNGDIPLFHFKESDFKYIDAYIQNVKNKNKSSKVVSDIIK